MTAVSLLPATRTARPWLWLSVPISVLAMAASLAGLAFESTYAAEHPNWAAQAAGQDAVNLLVAYPALLLLAWLAARGSLRSYLVWLGLLVYSAYSYLLSAGFLHFSAWFLVYVAVLALSIYALVGGLMTLDAVHVRAAFGRAPLRLAGGVLASIGVFFALLWLSEIITAVAVGTAPESATAAGLITNPVHMLDLALVLPAMVLTGILLIRGRPLGSVLVVPLYTFGIVMALAIIGMVTALALADEPAALEPVIVISAVLVPELWMSARLLAAISPRESPRRRPRGRRPRAAARQGPEPPAVAAPPRPAGSSPPPPARSSGTPRARAGHGRDGRR